MADGLSPEKRSWNMSRIKGKNTSIEVKVRKYLFSQGFRYRINVTKSPGKPDIVLPKYNAVVFVNGCFWHRHTGCKEAYMSKSRVEFWQKKFERNVQNDTIQREKLMEAGWRFLRYGRECEVRKNFEVTMDELIEQLKRA